jgi:signal transduction histidine kinase
MRSSSLVIIASTTLAAILFGVALIMAASMIKIVEEQRQVVRRQATHEANLRLAHHVHDETLQQMYGVILALKGAIARITPGTERGRLQATLDLAVQSWEDLRCFLQDLRTSGEELPLRESLRQRAAAFTHLTGLPVHLECSTTETPIPFEAATHLRAIVREALSNVYRHARATAVWIRLRTEDNMVILEIEDDGVGFDPASGHESNGHYGLAGMSERVTSMRGRLLVESAPDQRTRIIVRVPISIAQAE